MERTAACADLGLGRLAAWGIADGGPQVLACVELLPGPVTAAASLAALNRMAPRTSALSLAWARRRWMTPAWPAVTTWRAGQKWTPTARHSWPRRSGCPQGDGRALVVSRAP